MTDRISRVFDAAVQSVEVPPFNPEGATAVGSNVTDISSKRRRKGVVLATAAVLAIPAGLAAASVLSRHDTNFSPNPDLKAGDTSPHARHLVLSEQHNDDKYNLFDIPGKTGNCYTLEESRAGQLLGSMSSCPSSPFSADFVMGATVIHSQVKAARNVTISWDGGSTKIPLTKFYALTWSIPAYVDLSVQVNDDAGKKVWSGTIPPVNP